MVDGGRPATAVTLTPKETTPMRTRRIRRALLPVLIATGAAAQPPGYRWLDEHGNVHYAGRLDQVPERFRSQLPPDGPTAPPRPHLPAPAGSVQAPGPGECVLRLRATAARPGVSRSFSSCEACWKALAQVTGEEATRAECIATSVKSYR
jgi:hypothetical protein